MHAAADTRGCTSAKTHVAIFPCLSKHYQTAGGMEQGPFLKFVSETETGYDALKLYTYDTSSCAYRRMTPSLAKIIDWNQSVSKDHLRSQFIDEDKVWICYGTEPYECG